MNSSNSLILVIYFFFYGLEIHRKPQRSVPFVQTKVANSSFFACPDPREIVVDVQRDHPKDFEKVKRATVGF